MMQATLLPLGKDKQFALNDNDFGLEKAMRELCELAFFFVQATRGSTLAYVVEMPELDSPFLEAEHLAVATDPGPICDSEFNVDVNISCVVTGILVKYSAELGSRDVLHRANVVTQTTESVEEEQF
jgi:hypothetical protein